jgi:ribonuclease HII
MVIPTLRYEKDLWNRGFRFLAGIDEVGRGAWAGPVVAAAVILPSDVELPEYLRDSKLLVARQREELDEQIKELAISLAVAEISVNTINRVGISKASQFAMRKAIGKLDPSPDFHLVDYFRIRYIPKKKQLNLKKGDKHCASIAAASIVAKVYRDRLMEELHEEFEEYHFCDHKGYGTKAHQEAIMKHGLSDLHRLNFVPERLLRDF